jgi:gas vesicle protein
LGYLRGLTHGAIVGAVIGLLYAPDAGTTTRRRVARLLGQAETMMAADSEGAPAASAARRRAAGAPESRTRRAQS